MDIERVKVMLSENNGNSVLDKNPKEHHLWKKVETRGECTEVSVEFVGSLRGQVYARF